MVFLGLWFAVQLYLPLRQALFPTLVGWSGDGHRFSWRMRIHDRDADGTFRVHSGDGQVTVVDPYDWLTGRQADTMLTRPDMIHDFDGMLAHAWREAGHADVAVFAEIEMSLNGPPHVTFINPAVDLTTVRYDWWGTDDWVLRPAHRVAEGRLPDWLPPLPLQKPPF